MLEFVFYKFQHDFFMNTESERFGAYAVCCTAVLVGMIFKPTKETKIDSRNWEV